MKLFITLIFASFLLPGCKKTIDKQKENIIMQAMTSGEWKITSFITGGTNQTAEFSGFSFRYYENRTVDAIRAGEVKTGTWQENVDKMDISANFPQASQPLPMVNGNWHIEQSSWTFVLASQTTPAGYCEMRLEKL